MKKNILIVHHATGWGGAPNSMIKQIKQLDSRKYCVRVLLLKDSFVSEKLKKNNISFSIAQSIFYRKYYYYFTHSEASHIKIHQILKFLRLTILWLLSRLIFAPRELRAFKPDIIHLNSSVLTDWLRPSHKKAKVIMHIREPFRKGRLDLLHYFFRYQMKKYTDTIISISQDCAKRIDIPSKTHVIYNFTVNNEQKIKDKILDTNKVLYLGGYHPIKGFFTVVDSLDFLNKEIKILFCGDYLNNNKKITLLEQIKKILKRANKFHRRLNSAVKKLKNHPNAIYIGFTHNPSKLLKESEFLISPFSKPHFSMPIIEAFANKKCAIGSNVEGMNEIIDHGVNGLIIEKDNPIKLAKAINYLHSNIKMRHKMGNNGYSKAKKMFSTKNIKDLQDIYNRVV